jgi:hypothetical protein
MQTRVVVRSPIQSNCIEAGMPIGPDPGERLQGMTPQRVLAGKNDGAVIDG